MGIVKMKKLDGEKAARAAKATGKAVGLAVLLLALSAMPSDAGTWYQSGGNWYYKLDNGADAENCWLEIDGKSYYFNEYGIMQANTWIDGFYVGTDGAYVEGAKSGASISDGDYYLVREDVERTAYESGKTGTGKSSYSKEYTYNEKDNTIFQVSHNLSGGIWFYLIRNTAYGSSQENSGLFYEGKGGKWSGSSNGNALSDYDIVEFWSLGDGYIEAVNSLSEGSYTSHMIFKKI